MAAGSSEFLLYLFVIFTCLQSHITTAETVFQYKEEDSRLLRIVELHRQKRQIPTQNNVTRTTTEANRPNNTPVTAKPTTPTTSTSTSTTTPQPSTPPPLTSPNAVLPTTDYIRLPPGVTLPPGADAYRDKHVYYSSQTIIGSNNWLNFWVDLTSHPVSVKHSTLSDAHRVAVKHTLMFNFPFYGHDIRMVTIATGGFIYLSDFVHQWLTATQYIAPLMANIDTTLGSDSHLYYLNEANRFIVQWQQVHIKEHATDGPFTFQLHLLDDGSIYFIYKQMSLPVMNISTSSHPVKIGASDAYYFDRTEGNIRKRTIYEYHRLDIDQSRVKTGTVVIITPVKTCNRYGDCQSCVQAKIGFSCQWCPATGKCSDGMDRHRQSWIKSGCDKQDGPLCPEVQPFVSRPTTEDNAGKIVGTVLGVFLAILLVGTIGAVLWYGYKNPTTKIGQWLIKNRPSNWKVSFFKRESTMGDKYRVDSSRESTA